MLDKLKAKQTVVPAAAAATGAGDARKVRRWASGVLCPRTLCSLAPVTLPFPPTRLSNPSQVSLRLPRAPPCYTDAIKLTGATVGWGQPGAEGSRALLENVNVLIRRGQRVLVGGGGRGGVVSAGEGLRVKPEEAGGREEGVCAGRARYSTIGASKGGRTGSHVAVKPLAACRAAGSLSHPQSLTPMLWAVSPYGYRDV